jgi:hypothetical protein
MSCILDLTLLASQNLGLPLAQPFNKPFLSASLSEFWGMRWNVPQSQLLKVQELLCAKRGKQDQLYKNTTSGAAWRKEGRKKESLHRTLTYRVGQNHTYVICMYVSKIFPAE